MSLEYLKKLNSLVAEGFFVNDLLFLFKKNNKELEKRDKDLLKDALNYFQKIRRAQRFMDGGNNYQDGILGYYIRALRITKWKTITIFNTTHQEIETELLYILKNNKINTDALSQSIKYFKLLRDQLLKECNEITRGC